MLVLDLADDLLDHIFNSDDTLGAPKLIHHDGEVHAARTPPGEKIEHTHRFRHEERRADPRPNVLRRVARRYEREHVLHMDPSDHPLKACHQTAQAAWAATAKRP